MGKNSSLASMAGFIDTTVGIECVLGWWKHRVKLGFLNVSSVTVDGLQSTVGVDGKAIGAETNNRT